MVTYGERATLFARNPRRAVRVCATCAAALLVATISYPSQGMADDDPPAASDSKHVLSKGAAPGTHCDDPEAGHPHNYQNHCNLKDVHKLRSPKKASDSGNSELASKLSNPSAPMLAINTYLDVTRHGGSAPEADRASFAITIQPALPFPTRQNKGSLIFRPGIPIQFGQPFVTASGNVDTAVSFGNITLDTLFGKTLDMGLIIMGGVNTTFPTASKPELRADWIFGPEVVIGYASKKTGNVWNAIVGYTWSFPDHAQTVVGQYAYAINVGGGWQTTAAPFWSYSRESKTLRFPLGVGIAKTGLFGKLPVKVGAQAWLYTTPPGPSGPEWTVRFTVSPVVRRPW